MKVKRALVCGVTGQDGAYLTRFLIGRGCDVIGTTRSDPEGEAPNLLRLGLRDRMTLMQMNPVRRAEVRQAVECSEADEIYYLAAQSSVARSFQSPLESFEASAIGLLNVLEAARETVPAARILHAASGDCFGETSPDRAANEETPFRPRSPYAAAKCAAHHFLAANRIARGQFAVSAFLFSHESPLRPETFVVGKTLAAAKRIAAGSEERLRLGNVGVVRDWGLAADYVSAMWKMLQQDEPNDFVIATGRSVTLASLVEAIFRALGLDWRDHVDVGMESPRPGDIAHQHASPARAQARLGWSAAIEIDDLARRLVEEDPEAA